MKMLQRVEADGAWGDVNGKFVSDSTRGLTSKKAKIILLGLR